MSNLREIEYNGAWNLVRVYYQRYDNFYKLCPAVLTVTHFGIQFASSNIKYTYILLSTLIGL